MAVDFNELNNNVGTKYIESTMKGAPQLTLNRGDLVKLLKIVLVDGFNEQSVISVTPDLVGNAVTLNLSIGHGIINNQVIQLSGANEPDFNTFHRVLYSDQTTVRIRLNTKLQEITGNIKLKVAPLGYSLAYDDITNTGTACFKNSSQQSPAILKVIDALPPNGYDASWTRFARVAAGQAVSSSGEFINNEKTPFNSSFPNAEKTGNNISGITGIHSSCRWDYGKTRYESSGGGYADNYNVPNGYGTYPTNWRIIGDSNTFYLFIQSMGKDYSGYSICAFGLFKSINNAETGNIFLVGSDGWISSDNTSPYQGGVVRRNSFTMTGTSGSFGLFLYKNIYDSVQHWLTFTPIGLIFSDTSSERYWSYKASVNYINPLTGNVLLSPIFIKDSNNDFRGQLRGIQQLYGSKEMPNNLIMDNGNSMILQTKKFEWSTAFDNRDQTPYLFSLKDWEEA